MLYCNCLEQFNRKLLSIILYLNKKYIEIDKETKINLAKTRLYETTIDLFAKCGFGLGQFAPNS